MSVPTALLNAKERASVTLSDCIAEVFGRFLNGSKAWDKIGYNLSQYFCVRTIGVGSFGGILDLSAV